MKFEDRRKYIKRVIFIYFKRRTTSDGILYLILK